MVGLNSLKNLGRETKIGHCQVTFRVILIESGLFSIEGDKGKLEVERQGTIKAVGVPRISIKSCTKLIGIGSKSNDLQGANRTRRCTSSSVSQGTFCKTFPVTGGFSTFEHDPEAKEERMMEISFGKRVKCVFVRDSIEHFTYLLM